MKGEEKDGGEGGGGLLGTKGTYSNMLFLYGSACQSVVPPSVALIVVVFHVRCTEVKAAVRQALSESGLDV